MDWRIDKLEGSKVITVHWNCLVYHGYSALSLNKTERKMFIEKNGKLSKKPQCQRKTQKKITQVLSRIELDESGAGTSHFS